MLDQWQNNLEAVCVRVTGSIATRSEHKEERESVTTASRQ